MTSQFILVEWTFFVYIYLLFNSDFMLTYFLTC
ncbi:hypothetical protein VPHD63_0048 [Vibrio phage D63]